MTVLWFSRTLLGVRALSLNIFYQWFQVDGVLNQQLCKRNNTPKNC